MPIWRSDKTCMETRYEAILELLPTSESTEKQIIWIQVKSWSTPVYRKVNPFYLNSMLSADQLKLLTPSILWSKLKIWMVWLINSTMQRKASTLQLFVNLSEWATKEFTNGLNRLKRIISTPSVYQQATAWTQRMFSTRVKVLLKRKMIHLRCISVLTVILLQVNRDLVITTGRQIPAS